MVTGHHRAKKGPGTGRLTWVTDAVVIIVNYESGERLHRCLESVLAQEPPASRVLVVDNASSDGSAEGLPATVDVIRRADNGGFAAALLDGLAASEEPFVWTLNPDLVVQAGCFASANAALEADHRAGSVAPRVLQQDAPDRIDATGIGLTSFLGQINWDHDLLTDQVAREPHDVLGPLGGAALWRRVALERAGNFDPHFFLYWEDMDIALRLNRAGYECRTVPDACILHEGGGSVGHHSPRNVFYMVRNHWVCLLRSLPGPILRESAGSLLLAPIRASVLYARRGRGLSALAGLVCGAILAPAALWSRRRLPRSGSGDKAAQRIRVLMDSADSNRQLMRDSRSRVAGPRR
jgi:N-acetylglucosaminyl-diphospho-decaprenol L-rhamnosyltransferase